MKTRFVVEPVGMKMRYYDDLGDIRHDFSREELEDAHFGVIYGSVVVGYLITTNVLEEVYHE